MNDKAEVVPRDMICLRRFSILLNPRRCVPMPRGERFFRLLSKLIRAVERPTSETHERGSVGGLGFPDGYRHLGALGRGEGEFGLSGGSWSFRFWVA